jgi:nickel-type superoxide dismutase maturation protease
MGHDLADSNFKELLLWLMRLRQRFRVTGASMFPLLQPGDEVLIDSRAFRHQLPQVGDIVVAHHPTQAGVQIVKRVSAVHSNRTIQLKGDNSSESTDFDNVIVAQIIGLVTSRFG